MSNPYIKGAGNIAFIEGEDRYQINLLPNTLDDFVSDDNPFVSSFPFT